MDILPVEILYNVFKYFDDYSFIQLSLTNKNYNFLIKNYFKSIIKKENLIISNKFYNFLNLIISVTNEYRSSPQPIWLRYNNCQKLQFLKKLLPISIYKHIGNNIKSLLNIVLDKLKYINIFNDKNIKNNIISYCKIILKDLEYKKYQFNPKYNYFKFTNKSEFEKIFLKEIINLYNNSISLNNLYIYYYIYDSLRREYGLYNQNQINNQNRQLFYNRNYNFICNDINFCKYINEQIQLYRKNLSYNENDYYPFIQLEENIVEDNINKIKYINYDYYKFLYKNKNTDDYQYLKNYFCDNNIYVGDEDNNIIDVIDEEFTKFDNNNIEELNLTIEHYRYANIEQFLKLVIYAKFKTMIEYILEVCEKN